MKIVTTKLVKCGTKLAGKMESHFIGRKISGDGKYFARGMNNVLLVKLGFNLEVFGIFCNVYFVLIFFSLIMNF